MTFSWKDPHDRVIIVLWSIFALIFLLSLLYGIGSAAGLYPRDLLPAKLLYWSFTASFGVVLGCFFGFSLRAEWPLTGIKGDAAMWVMLIHGIALWGLIDGLLWSDPWHKIIGVNACAVPVCWFAFYLYPKLEKRGPRP